MKGQNKPPCFLTIAAIEYWKATAINKHMDSDYVKEKAYAEYERQLQSITKKL
jgi:hypothetical protein